MNPIENETFELISVLFTKVYIYLLIQFNLICLVYDFAIVYLLTSNHGYKRSSEII